MLLEQPGEEVRAPPPPPDTALPTAPVCPQATLEAHGSTSLQDLRQVQLQHHLICVYSGASWLSGSVRDFWARDRGFDSRPQNFYSHMSEEPDDFQSALVTTTACWLPGNRQGISSLLFWVFAKYWDAQCGSCWKWRWTNFLSTDCQSSLSFPWWLKFQSPQLSMLKQQLCWLLCSHHYCSRDDCRSSVLFPWWLPVITTLSTLKRHLCWLPVVTIVLMMTASHHHCSHDDFQSSQLCPRWSNICADCQSSLSFPWSTSSHHNKRNRGNPIWGANQHAVASRNYSHSCWLEVIGLLAHVRIKLSPGWAELHSEVVLLGKALCPHGGLSQPRSKWVPDRTVRRPVRLNSSVRGKWQPGSMLPRELRSWLMNEQVLCPGGNCMKSSSGASCQHTIGVGKYL